jgi:Zn-dependent peptidase ImmA (M78 family)
MRFFFEKISGLAIGWNERPLSESDFYALCRRFGITVDEMPLSVGGFYYCVMGRHFIALNSGSPPAKKLFVMFHELAHYLMHAPNLNETASYHGVGRQTRKEYEADVFATIALLPQTLIDSKTAAELVDHEGFDPEFVKERLRIMKRYGL